MQTNLQKQNDQWLLGDRGGREGLRRATEKTFGSDG